jgi:hypothetical protein
MAACEPAEAIWVVMKQPDGHAVLDALNDPPEGSSRVENTYAKTTPTAVLYRHARPYSDLSCRLGAGTSVEGSLPSLGCVLLQQGSCPLLSLSSYSESRSLLRRDWTSKQERGDTAFIIGGDSRKVVSIRSGDEYDCRLEED